MVGPHRGGWGVRNAQERTSEFRHTRNTPPDRVKQASLSVKHDQRHPQRCATRAPMVCTAEGARRKAHLACKLKDNEVRVFEAFVSTRFLCNNQYRQRNVCTARYTTVCVVKSKGRQQELTAAARLIGCGCRAAAAAAAADGYTTSFLSPFSST